jgi:antitoxin component YwqK of YwqJK toxin-antitoxin module
MKNLLLILLLLPLFSLAQREVQCGDALSVSKGTLVDSSSIQPRMNLESASTLVVGSTGELALLNEDGNFKMTFSIGRVRVTAINGAQVTFEITEKLGVVTINGVERSNFKEGAVVQFTEYKYDSPHLTETKYESGAIKESGYLLCGQKMGEWKEFHENGSKKCSYRTDKNGGIEGRYAEFDDQGKIAVEGEYRAGKKTGLWTEYFADGTIKSQGYYYSDAKTGKWIEHDASGKKVKKKY